MFAFCGRGRFFCIWALCTLSQLLPWFDLRTDALGYKLRCLKVQCIKIFALRNSIVVFLGFLSLHPVFSRCCLFFLWLRLWCDSYRSKMILVFSGRTRKNFLYEVHTKGYRLTDFLSEGKMRKSSEMYALCLYAFNTVFCGTFEIRPFWHWISIIFALCGTNIVRYTVFFIISYSQHIFRPLTLSYTISREIKKQIY